MRRTMGKLAGLPVVMLGAVLFFAGQANAAQILVGGVNGTVRGAPGSQVAVEIRLGTQGAGAEEVAGTQNDITFDPAIVSVAAASACVINPAISDRAAGCEDDPNSGPCKQLNRALDDVEGGKRFRGLILSLANTTAIPQDTVLYVCTFTIAENAALGTTVPLACSNEGASDPDGGAIATTCVSGQIVVAVDNTATPTATATVPPTTTPTNTRGETAAPPTATRTNTLRPPTGDTDDDGCQVVAPVSSHMGWLLFAPAALLLWSRRRSR